MSAARLTIFLAATLALSAQGLVNRRAPSFSLPDSAHAAARYPGLPRKLAAARLHETDCPVCKQLSVKLETVKKKYGAKVAVLAIVITPPENQTTVAKYVAETKITTPIVFDLSQVAISYFKATPQNPAFDTPHLFAISPTGMIVKDWGQNGTESPGFLGELDQLIARPAAKK